MSIETLVNRQNRDGGWPYVRGKSWTEPTVYAILAVLAAGEDEAAERGLRWIRANGRSDGGWAPQSGVDESTWVTALVALLPTERLGDQPHDAAIRWLLEKTGQESTFTYRFREWLLGNTPPPDKVATGWPWVLGTAAWVSPTSLAILALDQENRRRPSPALRKRIEQGRRFLLARACHDGGWNHGSARALGYDLHAYPETTGMALAALRGISAPKVELGLRVAKGFLNECRSADALNWLRLGLLAHGEMPAGYCPPPQVECRTLPETSLNLLVSAVTGGRSLFWS